MQENAFYAAVAPQLSKFIFCFDKSAVFFW